jgi:hypothetical protein
METETSSEAWEVLSGLLNHGPVAVVWHEGRGCVREDFDTILELKGNDTIVERTYQRGKVIAENGPMQPGHLCWTDMWTWARAQVTHWPYLDTILDMLRVRQGVLTK